MPGIASLASTPRHNGGRAQVGLHFPDSYFDIWAVDMIKQSLGIFPTTASATNWPASINSNGFPTAMPSAGNWGISQAYIYGVNNDVWVLDWSTSSGSATIAMASAFTGGSLTETIVSGTRREYTIVGSPENSSNGIITPGGVAKVTITISALTGPLTSLRLYRKTDESALNGTGATSIFNAQFLDRVKQFGVLRFMDWARCNEARNYKWDYRRPDGYLTWAGAIVNPSWYYGTATSTSPLNTFTVSTLPTLTNGLPVQFLMSARPNKLTVSSVVKGNPTQFVITAHGLSGGEKVTGDSDGDGGGSWTTTFRTKNVATGLTPEFTVTRIDANTISLPFDSTGFADPSTMALIPSLYITDGTVSKRVFRKGLTNHFYSEFGAGKVFPFLFTAVYDSTFDCFVMSGDGGGDIFHAPVPLSAMITLCNYTKAHPWFTYGYMCDNDFWTQTATQVKNNLLSCLIPRYESGNEIWNTGTSFWQTNYAQSIAAKTYGTTGFGVTAWNLGYAKRFNEVCTTLEAVHGTGANWQMILGCQLDDVSPDRLQGNSTINGGSSSGYPANRADYIATAPYTSVIFGGSTGNSVAYPGLLDKIDQYNQGGSLRTTAFNWMTSELQTASTLGWKAGAATLDDEIARVASRQSTLNTAGYTGRRGTGLGQTHYEGGPTQFAANSFTSAGYPANAPSSGRSVTYDDLRAFWLAWLASSAAADYFNAHFTRMSTAGIVYPSQYCIAGLWDNTSNQGLYQLNNAAAPAIPAFSKLVAWSNND